MNVIRNKIKKKTLKFRFILIGIEYNALPIKPCAVETFDEQKTVSALVLKAC
jgi:hypothetical protein